MAEPPRCLWCGGGTGQIKTVTLLVPDNLLQSEQEQSLSVHPEHEEQLRNAISFVRRSARPFVAALAVALLSPLLIVFAVAFLGLPERIAGVGAGLSLLFAGVVFTVF